MARVVDNSKVWLTAYEAKKRVNLHKAGQVVEDMIPAFCPVKTGATKESRQHHVGEGVVQIGVTTEYAPYLETGTSRMLPRPFLRPALQAARPVILKIFQS